MILVLVTALSIFILLHYKRIKINSVYRIYLDLNCVTYKQKTILSFFHVVNKSFNLNSMKYHALLHIGQQYS